MWADALPNLLIGLREGLEAGLVVSILLAALGKPVSGEQRSVSSVPVWLGVAAAAALALSFGAVLTFYRSILPTTGQEALGGALSVIAVCLVTWMIFWMRRTARGLSAHLREQVNAALTVSTTALMVTAFLAVGREGLETSLFLWTAAQASGQTTAPLAGAAAGIAIAVVLCVLLYRRAVRIRLDKFFNRTAAALIVIAGGVLAYGLGDLQDAGVLPGHLWVAFDLSSHVDAGSWWMSIITGVTELSVKMTWLQVVAYLGYLAVVLTMFFNPGQVAPAKAPRSRAPLAGRRLVTVGTCAVLGPALLAAAVIGLAPRPAGAATLIKVTGSSCAAGWNGVPAGTRTFTVENDSNAATEVNLIQTGDQGIVAEIETLGPGTRQTLSASLAPGSYAWRCLLAGRPAAQSAVATVAGTAGPSSGEQTAVKQVTVAELRPALAAYTRYVTGQLATMQTEVARVESALRDGDLIAARSDWVSADLTWQRVGEEPYGSFGDYGVRIDAGPQGFAGGVTDPKWAGLRRLEYGLWHGQQAGSLQRVAAGLYADVSGLRQRLPQLSIDPADLPVRAHEVLEDALRDQLAGATDQGSGSTYRELAADVSVTRVVLGELSPLLRARSPELMPTVSAQLSTLEAALRETGWRPLAQTPLAARQAVDAAVSGALETLAGVPGLLETPAH